MNRHHNRLFASCAALCAVAVSSCWHEGSIDYPQSTPTFSTGTAVPLGSSSDPKSKILESRWQQLIPATHLPTVVADINAMSFMGQSSGKASYPMLKITLSHTSATSLGTDFAKNLPSPVVVLDVKNYTLDWTAGKWAPAWPVPTPVFGYDGKSSLVIDIQKIADPLSSGEIAAATSGDPGRPDLPDWRYTAGGTGSGAWKSANATSTGKSPVQVNLSLVFGAFGDVTLSLRSDRLATGSKNVFAIGGKVEFTLRHGPHVPSPYALLVDTRFRTPVTLPGIGGRLIVNPLVVLPGSYSTSPTTLSVSIPKDKSLVGQSFRFQAILKNFADVWVFSNGAGAFIRSDV